jgi:hypothetical protein
VLKAYEAAELLATDALAPKRVAVAAAVKRPPAMAAALSPGIDPLAVALPAVRHAHPLLSISRNRSTLPAVASRRARCRTA